MKILQIIPHYVPAFCFGGPLRVAHSLGKSLVANGHKVTVCTTNLNGDNSFLDAPLDKKVNIDGVYVYYEAVENIKWGYSSSLKNRITKEIKTADIVITHFHYQYASYIGGLFARKYNKPLIVFAHGSLNKNGIYKRNTLLKYLYIRFFENKNFKYANFITFNCAEELELSFFSKNGKIIPNGVDPNDFLKHSSKSLYLDKYPQLKGKQVYIYLGRLNYTQKGIEILLPAFKKAIQKNNLLHLVLAGPDENNGELLIRKAIVDLELTQYVTITGMLNDSEKIDMLNISDVFVLPSPSEGLSIALLEALYMNLPVITTTGVGLHKTIQKNDAGIIIDYDQDQLSEAILSLTYGNQFEKFSKNGKNLINGKFTWDVIVAQFIEKIKKVLENH